jgi:hypothetical protein
MGMTETAQAWHADDETLRRWVDGRTGQAVSASVEQHLVACERCRGVVAALVPMPALEPAWESALAEIELPRLSWAERLLRQMHVRSSDATIVTSAVTMRASWLLGTIGILAFVVLSGLLASDGGVGLFLLVAPLVPVAGIVAAYGPSVDPMYDAVQATPYPMVRLVMLRTASLLVTSVPLVAVAGLLMPAPAYVAVAWLLPATGFVAVVLTASNWLDPVPVASVLAIGWVVAVAFAVRTGDPLAVFAPLPMLGYLAAVALAGGVFVQRLLAATPSWRLR